jgi:hypothetical protein
MRHIEITFHAVFSADFAGSTPAQWNGESAMNDDLITIEPRQQAVLRFGETEVHCRNVPEAWLAWAQLDAEEKARAVIEVGEESYDAFAIRRLRYDRAAAAA